MARTSSSTKPRSKPATRRRPTSRQAPNPTTPRTSDRGVPENLEARARGPEGRKAEATSSGAFADIDDRLNALEDQSKRAPSSSSEPASSSSSSRALSLSRPTSYPSTTGPMILELLVVSVDEILTHHRPPVPSRVGVVVLVFGALGLARGQAARPAAALAWGLVIASVYASSGPNANNGVLRALSTIGGFLSGGNAKIGAGGGGAAFGGSGLSNTSGGRTVKGGGYNPTGTGIVRK